MVPGVIMTTVTVVNGTESVPLGSMLQAEGRLDSTVIVVSGPDPFIGFTDGAESICGCCWTGFDILWH